MTSFSFYQQHLNRVSRSFSFCIPELKQPIRNWVAISYLLYRLADIIEDANWSNKLLQYQSFSEFHIFLKELPSLQTYQQWVIKFPPVSSNEQKLLEEGIILIQDFHQLADEIKNHIFLSIEIMLQGMIFFLQKQINTNEFRLSSIHETNLYSYYVAGSVGVLLSHLHALVLNNFLVDTTIQVRAVHFGIFLQKINMLKDQLQDEQNGKFFIFCRESLLSELIIHADNAMDYIKSIPIEDGREYRLFCAWALFIGLASIPWIHKSFTTAKEAKIPSKTTLNLTYKIRGIIDDNNRLDALFQCYRHSLYIQLNVSGVKQKSIDK